MKQIPFIRIVTCNNCGLKQIIPASLLENTNDLGGSVYFNYKLNRLERKFCKNCINEDKKNDA
jgi:hypothetical protein